MTLIELQSVRQALNEKLQQLERIHACCHTCVNFEGGRCTKFGPVPHDFQTTAEACSDWLYDGIPF